MSAFESTVFSPITTAKDGQGEYIPGLADARAGSNESASCREPTGDSRNGSDSALQGGNSSVYGASFNFVNSIVGAGIIAIPQAIQECGLILGVLLLLLVAYLVNCSVLMLIECGIKARTYDLEQLSEHLLGKRGYYFALLFMFVFGYGAQVAYLVIIGDTVPKAAQLLFPGTIFCNRTATLWLSATLLVLPLCLLRDLSSLSWTSALSIGADVVIVLIVLGSCISLHGKDGHFQAADTSQVNDTLFAGIGTMAFAFVCQHNSFMVFRSLSQPTYTEWKKVAGMSVGFACGICIFFGLVGFFAFYPNVDGDLLNNFGVDNVAIGTARLFLAVTMVFTYPMECYVTRHCVVAFWAKYTGSDASIGNTSGSGDRDNGTSSSGEDSSSKQGIQMGTIVSGSGSGGSSRAVTTMEAEHVDDAHSAARAYEPPHTSLLVHVVLTLLLWSSSLAIALVFEQLGVVSALTGAVAASMLGFVLPATLYLKSNELELREAVARFQTLWAELRGASACARSGSGDAGRGRFQAVDQHSALHQCAADGGDEDGDTTVVVEFAHHNHDVVSGGVEVQQKRRTTTVVLELVSVFRRFYLPFGLIVFGVLSLIIGVTTVFVSEE